MLSPHDNWKSETLDHVFNALALSSELSARLIYKGARVLRLLLNEQIRASLDIDASFAANVFVNPDNLEQLRFLTHEAVTAYFESQSPIRYELQKSTIKNRRNSGDHPRGWNVYWLDLDVRDLAADAYMDNSPPLRIDIAVPEQMSDKSIAPIELNGHIIHAITLERMAGEKMRAFLSSLPAYRNKIKEKKKHPPRVKDIYDLARIVRKRALEDRLFWQVAAQEFELACQSRCIDCEGIRSFKESWNVTQETYNIDATLPKDVPFNEVENILNQIVSFLTEIQAIPFSFELPAIEKI